MPFPFPSPCLLAVADVRHRIASRLVEGCDEWWQVPAAVVVLVVVVALVVWMYRRDAVGLPPWIAVALAALRLTALAAVAAALLDVQRIAEHEIVMPSRVAVLVDSSASMSLADTAAPDDTRANQALDLLDAKGLLAALRPRHEVSVWRFDADAESLVRLPPEVAAGQDAAPTGGNGVDDSAAANSSSAASNWRARLAPQGYETRLGEAVVRAIDGEPSGTLAGIVVLSDGGNNAGIDPRAAGAAAAKAGVVVHALGVGAERLPANVRVADLVAPVRVFPGDRFAVSAFLQPHGCAGERVRVDLLEQPVDAAAGAAGRVLDTIEVMLAADGELVPVRFDVPGLPTAGRRTLVVRVTPPAADRTAIDDTQSTEVDVVDRVTTVLLMAGGPSREYQFMRNVLERDKSFAVDVLLGTAAPGISQDARRILDAFPPSDEALGTYDAIVAFDYDWRRLEPAAQARLERWVSAESGGLMLLAGPVFMDAWLGDPRTAVIRGLVPVELRRAGQGTGGGAGGPEPQPLAFTRDALEAEFLWLGASRAASEAVWREFPGVYACFPAAGAKPGATVYARTSTGGRESIYLAGQFYGSGIVLSAGSGELWRLRSIEEAAYERLVAQVVRHVSQGRLLRGARRGRLIVDQDRVPVGGSVKVRVVTGDSDVAARPPTCEAVAPDGTRMPVSLVAEPARPGTLFGSFVAVREGGWQVEVESLAAGDEPLSRRIQVQLPDRERANPRLDRGLLTQLALATGGTAWFSVDGAATAEAVTTLAAALPDRSRREYETGAADTGFKQRLNAALLAVGCGCLCIEWILRRLARLA
jgi:hypothetical protein